jgi:hypothetical protein
VIEENFNPGGRVFSAASTLCCAPNSLASRVAQPWGRLPLSGKPVLASHGSSMDFAMACGAAAFAMLGYSFPRDAAYLTVQAGHEAASRLWAGIHCRCGNQVGLALDRPSGDRARQGRRRPLTDYPFRWGAHPRQVCQCMKLGEGT